MSWREILYDSGPLRWSVDELVEVLFGEGMLEQLHANDEDLRVTRWDAQQHGDHQHRVVSFEAPLPNVPLLSSLVSATSLSVVQKQQLTVRQQPASFTLVSEMMLKGSGMAQNVHNSNEFVVSAGPSGVVVDLQVNARYDPSGFTDRFLAGQLQSIIHSQAESGINKWVRLAREALLENSQAGGFVTPLTQQPSSYVQFGSSVKELTWDDSDEEEDSEEPSFFDANSSFVETPKSTATTAFVGMLYRESIDLIEKMKRHSMMRSQLEERASGTHPVVTTWRMIETVQVNAREEVSRAASLNSRLENMSQLLARCTFRVRSVNPVAWMFFGSSLGWMLSLWWFLRRRRK